MKQPRRKLTAGQVVRGFLLVTLTGVVCIVATYLLVVNRHVFLDGDWRYPPLAPGAREVQRQDFGDIGQGTEVFNMYLMKLTTYTTDSTPEQVYSFYRDKFAGSGWKPDTWGRFRDPGEQQIYNQDMGQSTYFIDITARVNAAGVTEVEVGSVTFPHY